MCYLIKINWVLFMKQRNDDLRVKKDMTPQQTCVSLRLCGKNSSCLALGQSPTSRSRNTSLDSRQKFSTDKIFSFCTPNPPPLLVVMWFIIHGHIQVCIALLALVLQEYDIKLPDTSLPVTEPGPFSFSKPC